MARATSFKALALLPAFALAGLTIGCGSGGNGSGGTGPSAGAPAAQEIPAEAKDAKLAAMVPAGIAADGKIVVGQDQSYAPNEFVDNGKVVGFDVDLGNAIAQKLGLTAEFQNAAFSGIIAGVGSGQYELAMSSFTINAERLQTVDMVSYYSAGTSLAVPKGNPDKISLDDLCGKNIAVQQGTVQVDDLTKRSDDCVKAGKPAITMQQFQAQTDVNLQVQTKRSQGMLADSPVIDYAVKQTGGNVEVVGQPYDSAPYGIALKKGQGTYAQAIQGAVQAIIDDGTYAKILAKWGLNTAGAVQKAELNPAVS
ncbi:polar amino acid transport system substrate-binding protein [Amycolatopsis bartoniae]|uniref:ABC transporter substrate-binding protein n=1 Tax=Amycolatopsis bartoniae TaxID=941986 RepID=A0A8H9J163_9PSEU|nr:ABC transporter substrate-binding protein [Amycolatopsis bartoniae]MBB2933322.1 polar amino acid transport system substrate-binding protein [Amycolatopsis bartoniae]GHF58693.1 ABC transporter substrate-binding protein [Amycolatopsis bartoniae]